ncbi:MAG TPA: RHS repeat-associated core domain-containing protein [Terriglobales bacterium]|nr:RHS repeat-associated core domain-containing protein [Terriglobales bacterium]
MSCSNSDEHDSESNTEHTQFRQLSTTEGRWLSPDPYMGSMDLANPQSLNRYAYVNNNPLRFVDPFGLDSSECHASGDGADQECNVVGDDGGWAPIFGGGCCGGDGGPLPLRDGPFGGDDGGGSGGPGGQIIQIPLKPLIKPSCQQLAAGQTAATDFKTWLAAYTNASLMLDQWLSGTGPVNRDFGPNTPESQMMMSAYGLAGHVSEYLAGGRSSGNQDFGLHGLVSSGLNPTTQFVGSHQWSMSQLGGNLNITITNSTTAWSFFYHLPGLNPNPPNRFDSVLNPGWHAMGRVNQTFHIQVPCS